MKIRSTSLGMMVFCCIVTVGTEVSAGWLAGSSLTVSVDDSALGTNFNQNVTLGSGMTSLDGGEMTVAQSIIPSSATSQWLTFHFESASGGPLAGDPHADWRIQLSNVQTSSPANVTTLIVYWTVNGVATSPINPASGFTNVEPNPINPSLGPVYAFFPTPSALGYTSSSWFVFANPYNFISQGGINPSSANGFTFGLLETDVVPEPSSLCSLMIGAGVLGIIGLARLKPNR